MVHKTCLERASTSTGGRGKRTLRSLPMVLGRMWEPSVSCAWGPQTRYFASGPPGPCHPFSMPELLTDTWHALGVVVKACGIYATLLTLSPVAGVGQRPSATGGNCHDRHAQSLPISPRPCHAALHRDFPVHGRCVRRGGRRR